MIAFNNGVTNIKNTPGIYTGQSLAELPNVNSVAVGTIFIYTFDGAQYMKQSDGTSWLDFGGGGGSTPGIDSVLAVNQPLQDNRVIDTNGNHLTILSGNSGDERIYIDDDIIGIGSNPILAVDTFNNIIATEYNFGAGLVTAGIYFGFAQKNYLFGDELYQIQIDSFNSVIRTFLNGDKKGFEFDDSIHKYSFGDYNNTGNYNRIEIDDGNESIYARGSKSIQFNTGQLIFDGPLTTGGNHSNSGLHLKVTINGNDYVIQLLNP